VQLPKFDTWLPWEHIFSHQATVLTRPPEFFMNPTCRLSKNICWKSSVRMVPMAKFSGSGSRTTCGWRVESVKLFVRYVPLVSDMTYNVFDGTLNLTKLQRPTRHIIGHFGDNYGQTGPSACWTCYKVNQKALRKCKPFSLLTVHSLVNVLCVLIDHPRSDMIYSFVFVCLSVCLFVCLSDDNFFESLDVRSLYFAHPIYLQAIRLKFVYEGHRVKVKVTGGNR